MNSAVLWGGRCPINLISGIIRAETRYFCSLERKGGQWGEAEGRNYSRTGLEALSERSKEARAPGYGLQSLLV